MQEATKAIHPKLSADPRNRMQARVDELVIKIAALEARSQAGDHLASTLAKTLRLEHDHLGTQLRERRDKNSNNRVEGIPGGRLE